MEPEQHRSHDSEIAMTSANRPKEIPIVGLRCDHSSAIRKNHAGRETVVASQAHLAHQLSFTARDRQPAYRHIGACAQRDCQTMRGRRLVDRVAVNAWASS